MTDKPWVVPPEGFEPLDRDGEQKLEVGVQAARFELFKYKMSPGREGWIRELTLWSSDWGNSFHYELTLNGTPLQSWKKRTMPVGDLGRPSNVYIYLPPACEFKIFANFTAETFSKFEFHGWAYPLIGRKP